VLLTPSWWMSISRKVCLMLSSWLKFNLNFPSIVEDFIWTSCCWPDLKESS
jgi:hypothetical protein